MISIIIPIYNVSAYLRRCLDSIYCSNNDVSIEVLLVNDGSTDDSLSICSAYEARYPEITRIVNKANGGLSDARNAGTTEARGEWIFYLDSDDWLAPGGLKTLLTYAEDNACDLVVGSFYYAYDTYMLYDDQYVKDGESIVLARTDAMKALIEQHHIKNFAWGKLYKSDLVKNTPFRKGVYFEDSYWQHLIFHQCSKIGYIQQPLYYYYQRDGSISSRFSEKNIDLLKGYEERLEFIKKYYPDMTGNMVTLLWKTAKNLAVYAENTGDVSIIELYKRKLKEISH